MMLYIEKKYFVRFPINYFSNSNYVTIADGAQWKNKRVKFQWILDRLWDFAVFS